MFTLNWCVLLICGLLATACGLLTEWSNVDAYGAVFVLCAFAVFISGLFILIEE